MKKPVQKHKIKGAAPPPPESEFSFTLVRVAVGQICQSTGFRRSQNRALEVLTDITTRYLTAIAKLSAAAANSDGRTQSNISDVVSSLEEIASVQGFPGSSNVRSRSLFTSAVIKDLIIFVKYTDEIPFAQPLPPRKNIVKGSLLKARDNRGWYNSGGMKHVPRWLPVVAPVERSEKREEREGEVKWGCLGGEEEERGERKMVKREIMSDEIERLEKRGKVEFKIGDGKKMIAKRPKGMV
ncbi:hypothetical protein ACS0TY_018091 [Phlomoides rotata]